MSTAVVERPTEDTGLGTEIVRSFLPRTGRLRALIEFLPLSLIVAGQALVALLTLNTYAYSDEGLYDYAGRSLLDHWLHGTPSTPFGSFFSGAPGLYPIVSGALDAVGGLALTRAFSTVCICLATVSIYFLSRKMFTGSATWACLVYATASSTLYLSHLATYDAPALLLLVVALTVLVCRYSVKAALVAGLLLGLAVATKYVSAIWVPSILLIPVVLWRTRYALARSVLAAVTCAAVLGVGLDVWHHQVWHGIVFTTVSRTPDSPTSLSVLLESAWQYAGVAVALCLAGGVLLWIRGRRLLAALLVFTLVVEPAEQIRITEITSLSKHLDFGVALAAPLAGYLIASLMRAPVRRLVAGLVLIICCWQTVSYGHTCYRYELNNRAQVTAIISRVRPGMTVMGDGPNSVLYYYSKTHNARLVNFQITDRVTIRKTQADVLFLDNAPTRSAQVDLDHKLDIQAAMNNPDYVLVADLPCYSYYHKYRWFIWVRKTAAGATPAVATSPTTATAAAVTTHPAPGSTPDATAASGPGTRSTARSTAPLLPAARGTYLGPAAATSSAGPAAH